MSQNTRFLHFCCQRNTVMLTLAADVDDDARPSIEDETETVLRGVCDPSAVVFLLDFEGQPRCRPQGLQMLLGVLWKYVRNGSGKLLICNPTPRDRDTLKRMRLDRMWPMFATREEALAALAGTTESVPAAAGG